LKVPRIGKKRIVRGGIKWNLGKEKDWNYKLSNPRAQKGGTKKIGRTVVKIPLGIYIIGD